MSSGHFNLLLSDDDSDDCYFFQEALNGLPISTHLTTVHDGEQLMEFLVQQKTPLPHVLFLDLNMPRKNGFECLLEIKDNKNLKHLQVIIFSTSFDPKVVDLLFNNGAQYIIRKPPEFSQLKKVIHLALTLISKEIVSQPTRDEFVLTKQNAYII
jgi:CheY-like chemotaxis protein